MFSCFGFCKALQNGETSVLLQVSINLNPLCAQSEDAFDAFAAPTRIQINNFMLLMLCSAFFFYVSRINIQHKWKADVTVKDWF